MAIQNDKKRCFEPGYYELDHELYSVTPDREHLNIRDLALNVTTPGVKSGNLSKECNE